VSSGERIEHEWIPIGTLLLRRGLISAEQLELALTAREHGGPRLGQLLVSWGWVSSRDIAVALAEQFQLPFHDLAAASEPVVDFRLPAELASELEAVTIEIADDHIAIGVDDPTNIGAIERLRDSLDRPLKLAVIDPGARSEQAESAVHLRNESGSPVRSGPPSPSMSSSWGVDSLV